VEEITSRVTEIQPGGYEMWSSWNRDTWEGRWVHLLCRTVPDSRAVDTKYDHTATLKIGNLLLLTARINSHISTHKHVTVAQRSLTEGTETENVPWRQIEMLIQYNFSFCTCAISFTSRRFQYFTGLCPYTVRLR
jgi:hypothetical protein